MPARKLTVYVSMAVGITGLSVLGIILQIRRKRCSELHTFSSMLRQHLEYCIFSLFGTRMTRKLEKDSISFIQVQEETLLKILKSNADTEYGLKYNFGGINDKAKYVSQHPLTRYKHYESYIGKACYHKTTELTRSARVCRTAINIIRQSKSSFIFYMISYRHCD